LFQQTEEQWNIIFYTTVGILIFEAVVYLIFGSGEEQSWNRPNDRITPAGNKVVLSESLKKQTTNEIPGL
jgi:ACS family sodium-dependent inorganic phosphate cotransporter